MSQSNMQASSPSLPPLYFVDKHSSSAEQSPLTSLPPELLRHCLDFADWGDLAKLSTVETQFSTLVNDAAEFGGHEAKWELAQSLLEGSRGLARNPTRAMTLLTELAGVSSELEPIADQTPFAPAMKRIAHCHLEGNGVEKSKEAGVSWLEAAHEQGGDVEAAHELALMFEYGEHEVEQEPALAAEWFRKAAEGGHVEAMVEYGLVCELGCGREQSDEEALEWYMKAANEGHTTAKFSVGEAFEEARGVPQSDEEACLWYYKAAIEGDEDSKKALRRLHDIARIVVPGVGQVLNA